MTGTRCRRLAEVQIELVRSARGQVDKLTGDGLMAIWFIDAKEREVTLPRMAIECAKAVVARIQEVLRAEQLDGQMDVRIGMHCGPAAFGDFGAKERIAVTVLGHTVNIAARYEQAKSSDPALGRIRVSRELKTLVDACLAEDRIQFTGPATVEVKHGVRWRSFGFDTTSMSR
jgi:class 3 adenylate cyclase